jgi:hypothetical protein
LQEFNRRFHGLFVFRDDLLCSHLYDSNEK